MVINNTCSGRTIRIAVGVTMFAILLLADGVDAVPVEQWNKTFGGKYDDAALSVQQTSDGGYILTGFTGYNRSTETLNAFLIKTDANGNWQWNKTLREKAVGRFVQQTSEGGYIIAGYSWLIKADANGNQLWSKTFGGKRGDKVYVVQQTSDGGYILTGMTYSYGAGDGDAWLIKTDANGNEQWSKTFGGKSDDWADSVQQTLDGGYILAGVEHSYGAGNYGAWLIKTDANGNEQWSRIFEGSGASHTTIQQTSDGGYILASTTNSYGAGSGDIWLIKTDSNGNEQWNKTFGGKGIDWANSIQRTSDDGYILAGTTYSFGAGNGDVWLIKTDSNGNEQWNKTFGGKGDDGASTVKQTLDGGYILAGETESYGAGRVDAWLIKISGEIAAPKPTITSIPESNKIVEAANQYSKLFNSEFWGNEARVRADGFLKSYTDPLSVTLKAAKSILTSVLGAAKMNSAAGIIDDLGKSYSAFSATDNAGLLEGMDVKAKGIGGNTLSEEFTTLTNLINENKDPKQQLVVVSNKLELYRDMLNNPEKYDSSAGIEWSGNVKTKSMGKNILLSMLDSAQEFIDALKINYGMEVPETNLPPSQSSKKIPGFQAFSALILIVIIAFKMKKRSGRQ